jgi:DNA invertase Pin-like site-specific DNA recombinase
MRKGYTARTDVHPSTKGLWPLSPSAEPGPDFAWGLLTRRSKLNADGTEGSTRRQEQELRRYIAQNSAGRVVRVYSEIVSAYDESARRDELENALADLKAGHIQGIAAWRPDRMVRRISQFRRVMLEVEHAGGRLLFLKPALIDTADAENLAFTTVFLDFLVAFAQMESEATADRVLSWHADKARQGLPHRNSMRPFGHTEDWFAIVDDEQGLIREAAERVIKGEAVNAIAKDWTLRGVRTPRGATRWGPDTLKCILTSPRMVGQRSYDGELFTLEDVPSILERPLWERCSDILNHRTGELGPRYQRMLSGILLCGKCNLTLVGNRDRRNLATYVCKKIRGKESACGGVEALCTPVDVRVGELTCEFLNDHERVSTLLRQHASGPEMDALHERFATLNDSLTALDDAAFHPPAGAPRLPMPRYWQQVEAITAEREAITRRLAVTREASLLTEALGVEWTPEEWEGRPLAWRRAILKLTVRCMTLEPRGSGKGRVGPATFDPERVLVEFAA